MPGPRCAGGGQRAMGWAGAAAKHRGQSGMQRIINLLWADKVDVTVKSACGQDMAFTCNGLC